MKRNENSILTDLGIKYKTDKVDIHHSFDGQCYTDIYNNYLESIRLEKLKFLEIGVRLGSSIKMWSEYFPNSEIVGVDIDPSCKQYEKDNIKIEIGSQEDEKFLSYLISKYQYFDIVLDDGSHINDMIIKSFNVLSKVTKRFYMIEDLRNSYEDLTEDVLSWPGMSLNLNLNPKNNITRSNFNDKFLSLIKSMDYRNGDYRGIYFHPQILILENCRNI